MPTPLPRRNPLPQLIPARLHHLQKRISERMWLRQQPLAVMRSEEQSVSIGYGQATSLEMQPLQPGEYFGSGGDTWSTTWLRIDIAPAVDAEAGRRFLRWQCQGETTVWIDGRPWAGLDIGHRECPVPDEACRLWLECCNWQTGIWISMLASEAIGDHGIRFERAQLAVRDSVAWDCHCDLDVIVQMSEQAVRQEPGLKLPPTIGHGPALEAISPRLRRILGDVDSLCDVWQESGSLTTLHDACQEFFRRWPAEHWQPTAALCGHTHIDLVWLWPESATRKKIVHSFATVLQLMERYPEIVFTQSMPALYRMLEVESPELMRQVKAHIETGRWEVLGGFEVEPDTNLPGGEALARSIVMGQKKIQELTGHISEVAWIPDVFGYSQCLPQIMALGGVKYFYTTKMTWSKVTRFPYTSFIWRGADGTEILAHLGTTDYNGEVLLDAHDMALAHHRQAGVHAELLFPTGYGDGGGGPTELHAERARRFENLSGAPRTEWTRADDFFARMSDARDQLPVYQGELYLEFHRGTYTTQSEFKRLYRRAERSLQSHEAVRAALGLEALPDEAWLRLLFAHFHDAIPGSSIGQVYSEMNPELEALGDQESSAALDALASGQSGGSQMAFNPLPYARLANVRHDGQSLQVRLPALGSAEMVGNTDKEDPILEASNTVLRHARVTARFDQVGQLSELTIDDEPLALDGQPGFVLSPDDPAAFDAWDIDHHAARLGRRVAQQLKLQLIENSPARAVLESQPVSIGESSELQLRYILEAGSTHLRVEPTVSWRESHKLLRYVAPTRYRGRLARFGCPFGAIERPQLPGTESDEAMWEVPASRWAAVQYDGGTDGLALLAESKLGFAARDGVLCLSLLRSAKWPDERADLGLHTMPFAIGRLQLECKAAHLSTSMAADAVFSPPVRYEGQLLSSPFEWHALGSLNASWCAPSTTNRGSYLIRLHETAGRQGTAQLQLNHAVSQVQLVDFFEKPLQALAVSSDGSVEIPYQPWSILTLHVGRDSHSA